MGRRVRSSAAAGVALATALVASAGWWLIVRRQPPSAARDRPAKVGARTRAERPDILLVVYDARRRDDFSFGPHGNRRGDTPFLAGLAQDSLSFPQAVSPGCWTAPVHAAVFSGLGVCDLGNDYYNPGFASFPAYFKSLAEILREAGYDTVALTDHPYFFNPKLQEGLLRGFRLFDVVNDYEAFTFVTNIDTPEGRIERRAPLDPRRDLSWQEMRELTERFNRGEQPFGPESEVDREPETGILLPRLEHLYGSSPYFERRYRRALDKALADRGAHPFFLFLNIHMATIAQPDPSLFSRWLLETVLLNARARGAYLRVGQGEREVQGWLSDVAARLGVPSAPYGTPRERLKQIFDNRFYDSSFRAVSEYLDARRLSANLLTVVTSDHGMSFREHGEDLLQHGGARPFEYITSVPLVIQFPRGSELRRLHGTRKEHVSLLDLFPTLIEMGLGPGVFQRKLPVRGRSLLERIRRNDFDPVLLSECSLGPTTSDVLPGTAGYAKAVYDAELKLIHAPRLYRTPQSDKGWPIHFRLGEAWKDPAPAPELRPVSEPLDLLFDLATDPLEARNLAGERAADVERLKRIPSSWACEPIETGARAPEWDPAARETLKALGYLP